jgi:Na+/H+-dicarboxylate symporter
MKLYTQILIAMIVGILIGLLFGPQSPFFNQDLYKVSQSKNIEFRTQPNDQAKVIVLTQSQPLTLNVLNVQKDAQGKNRWAEVSFELNAELLLSAQNQALRDQLKANGTILKAGTNTSLWMKIPYRTLKNGEEIELMTPVSAFGSKVTSFLQPFGDLFMRLLKMVIIPLVFASLLVGVANLGDVRKLGRLGGLTLLIYLVTTALAVGIGLLCTHLFSPGSFLEESTKIRLLSQYESQATAKTEAVSTVPSVVDGILQLVPTNPMSAFVKEDMLQIIFFALVLGIALSMLKEKGQTLIRVMDDLQEAMILIIQGIMKLAPIGVAALVANVVGQSGIGVLKALIVYGLTVLIGLLLHVTLVYGGILKFGAKIKVIDFIKAIRPAQMVAFSTSSSSATLPVTIECAEKNLGVSSQVASFVLPLGSTVNMDGTALYQGVATMFIAQVFGIDLSFSDQISIVLTATLASIGAAGVPGAGMVTLTMVLGSVGVPVEGLALILGIDRLLDMFRTTVNITGDLVVAKVMQDQEI